MSHDHVDIPQDVFAQLLSNIQVAAKEQRSNTASVDGERSGLSRNCDSTAVLAGERSKEGLQSTVETQTDSELSDCENDTAPLIDKDGSWPLAKWQYQTRAPLQDARKSEKASRKATEDTAGRDWFHMKAKEVTDSVKRDWRLLRLRATFDPKRFYKSFDSGKIPKYFQMGTIIEGMAEFYSARMAKKERKRTLTEELLADIQLKQQRKRRFEALQEEREELSKQRKKIRALHKRSKHRPKH